MVVVVVVVGGGGALVPSCVEVESGLILRLPRSALRMRASIILGWPDDFDESLYRFLSVFALKNVMSITPEALPGTIVGIT